MALTTNQKKELTNLKDLVAAKEAEIRVNYPATFSTNGNLFFDLFKDLNKQIEALENA